MSMNRTASKLSDKGACTVSGTKNGAGKDGSEIRRKRSHSETSCHCHCHSNHNTEAGEDGDKEEHASGKAGWIRAALSFCLLAAGLVMDHSGAAWFSSDNTDTIRLIWYLVAFLPVGIPVVIEAFGAFREKEYFSEFTLMSVASIGAFLIGEFPEAVAVMLFYTVGETLQGMAVDRATRNISSLLDVRPERAEVVTEDGIVSRSPKDVLVGETVEVRPGDRVPLDGTLLSRPAMFDTSALTGESVPREIVPGGEVLAGMIASGQPVRIRVTRPYDNSELARILSLVRDASSRKAPAELFIRRFARIYTPVVMVIAVLIVAIPALAGLFSQSFTYNFSDWLYRGLVFLVISCPCALVISVPLGYFAGIGAASRLGILFKGGNYLDAVARINCIAFDKTGTLTEARFGVVRAENKDISMENLLEFVLSVESKSSHPVALAAAGYAKEKGAVAVEPESLTEIPGRGAEAVIAGSSVLVGNARLLEERQVAVPEEVRNCINTTVLCAVDGKYAGMLELSDVLKKDARAAIEGLKKLGISDIVLLSGDKDEITRKFADELGIDEAHGGLLPENKAEYVEKKAEIPEKYVAFVGDGMNDAPVLALSDVGIAMGGLGSDAAIESADAVIQTDRPSKVVTSIKIGRSTRRIVTQNIVGAISVKLIVLLAGALGLASLWGAVFADVGVALLAVLNSVRIFGKKFE